MRFRCSAYGCDESENYFPDMGVFAADGWNFYSGVRHVGGRQTQIVVCPKHNEMAWEAVKRAVMPVRYDGDLK